MVWNEIEIPTQIGGKYQYDIIQDLVVCSDQRTRFDSRLTYPPLDLSIENSKQEGDIDLEVAARILESTSVARSLDRDLLNIEPFFPRP